MADQITLKRRRKIFPYQVLDGARLPLLYDLQTARDAEEYVPKKGDIFIVSYPKCGTTWVQYIVYLLCSDAQNPDDVTSLCKRVPFVERDGFPAEKEKILAFKYHLPPEMIPFSAEAKYIYVARNVMDAVVSYYHFFKSIPHFLSQDISFDDCLDAFLTGECLYGDYVEHLLYWYERREEPNVLFLTYESMKRDHKGAVVKIAKFIGKDLTGSNEKLLNDVLKYSHVSYMKEQLGPALNDYIKMGPRGIFSSSSSLTQDGGQEIGPKPETGISLIRKGKIGDWKANFTDAQKDRTIAHFLKKTKHTDVYLLWPEIFGDAKIQP